MSRRRTRFPQLLNRRHFRLYCSSRRLSDLSGDPDVAIPRLWAARSLATGWEQGRNAALGNVVG